MSPAEKTPTGIKVVATNRRAFHDYHILDRIEAGIELRGAEVKSIRDGHFSLNEAYALIDRGEVILRGLHVIPYKHARADDQESARPKRLLLHHQEIDRLFGQTTINGHTLIPLRLYFKRGMAKIELALCKGKQAEDKREALRRKTADREAERAIASHPRRG